MWWIILLKSAVNFYEEKGLNNIQAFCFGIQLKISRLR
ncbi:unknown [[Mannheimia] succiniciproducens MBEL55E]|uniref:Uncharacterized protein n=1 Tax=Mannheimia succiniciproducens (strain KCTC 0769BP / MBEL55E) TaxID=221988 RepID=Q65QU2_MANSM|nr:unknown [[Mannheimia] succiniciproducens MBEL55E]